MKDYIVPAVALLFICIVCVMYLALKYKGIVKQAMLCKFTGTFISAAVALYGFLRSGNGWVIIIGVTFCAIADVLLEYRFNVGVVFFILGHITYITAFILMGGFSWYVIPAAVIPAAVLYFVVPKALSSGIPKTIGILYAAVIGLMLAFALPKAISGSLYGIMTALGASLFFFSDCVIASNFTKKQTTGRDILILSTYYIGQLLIAAAVIFYR